jgi:hypothetical protein
VATPAPDSALSEFLFFLNPECDGLQYFSAHFGISFVWSDGEVFTLRSESLALFALDDFDGFLVCGHTETGTDLEQILFRRNPTNTVRINSMNGSLSALASP